MVFSDAWKPETERKPTPPSAPVEITTTPTLEHTPRDVLRQREREGERERERERQPRAEIERDRCKVR